MDRNRSSSFNLFAGLALTAWGGAAFSTWGQKSDADQLIRDASDVSAVQIQQLNGSVTSHALVALIIACALTIPFLIVAMSARIERVGVDEVPSAPPRAEPTSDENALRA